MKNNLTQALTYVSKGWHVFPLIEGGKIPLAGSKGFLDATQNVGQIKKWWSENPNYNIGVRCGYGYGVICLDVDKKNDKNGFLWLEHKGELPITLNQITPSGGEHFIFKAPEEPIPCSADKLAPGIDIRGDGGYFVAAPSSTIKTSPEGKEGVYEWKTDQGPDDMEPASAPEWLLNELRILYEIEDNDEKKEPSSVVQQLLPISAVIEKYGLRLDKLANGVFVGTHPTHGSSNGKNFRINTKDNVWCCYRHTKPNGKFVGGGTLSLIALLEGILECHECAPKALTGDRFKKVLEIIEDKFGISKDKIDVGTIEQILYEIENMKEETDPIKAIQNLEIFLPRISKVSPQEQILIFHMIKNKFKLKITFINLLKSKILALHNKQKYQENNNVLIDFDKNNTPLRTDKNILAILEKDENLAGVFAKDTFDNEIKIMKEGEWVINTGKAPRAIKDDDVLQTKRYIINNYNLQYKLSDVNEAIMAVAAKNRFDSLTDYLTNLQWDGVKRLDQWLIKACRLEDNVYHRWVSKLFLVAAVRRALVPAVKFDHVIVLAGEQATLKSTLIETLASEKWYTTMKFDEKDKDIVQKMQGHWIIELGEGVPLKKKDMDELKMFLVDRVNKERFAYARHVETYERRSIFVMTINPTLLGYLPDPTGNRRFLPIRITEEIDIDYVKENKDQLLSEAVIEHKDGFKIYLDKNETEIIELLKEEHAEAEMRDDWKDKIIHWLITEKVYQKNKSTGNIEEARREIPERGTCLTIWENVFGGDAASYEVGKHGRRIGAILTKIGLKPKGLRIEGVPRSGYCFREFAEELIQKDKKNLDREIKQLIQEQPKKQEIRWEKDDD